MHWKLSKIKYPSTLKSNEILYKRANKFCCFIINKYCRELTRQCVSHTTTHLQGMQGQRLSGGWSGILEVWNSANHSSAKYRKNIEIWFIHIRVHHSIQLQLKIYLQCIKSGCNCFEIHLYTYILTEKIFFWQITCSCFTNVIIYTFIELSMLILLHWIFHSERWWRFWGFQTPHSRWWLRLLSSVQGRWLPTEQMFTSSINIVIQQCIVIGLKPCHQQFK